MLPGNSLSTEAVVSPFVSPDDRPFNTKMDYELGGISHQDPSQGLRVQVWRAYFLDGSIWIEAETTGEKFKVIDTAGAIYVSLAFDQNMRVAVAWMWQGYMYLYYFDTVAGTYRTDVIPGSCPRLALDDKRDIATGARDVVFLYLYQGNLCVRNQRDRYLVEHVLGPVPAKVALMRVGMGTNNRLQIEAMQSSIAW